MEPLRHFIDLDRFASATLRRLVNSAAALKRDGAPHRPLAGKALAMVFEKPSTRTRVSFEIAMRQSGGDVVVLDMGGSHLARGETIADTARVLSRYVDVIMMRTDLPAKLDDMAEHADVPVVNGLTDWSHPCQLMADVLTFEEHRGPIADRVIAWCGDGNNTAVSWIHASVQFGFELRMAIPLSLRPPSLVIDWARAQGGRVTLEEDPVAAVRGAACVVTDTWVSMGDAERERRHALLTPYLVDERLMKLAASDAIFMHCLPAHRGEEVSAGVIDGAQSVVWDEAENRLHAQKAILHWCLLDEFADD